MAASQYKQQFENANKELLEWKTKCVEMTKQNEILRQQFQLSRSDTKIKQNISKRI